MNWNREVSKNLDHTKVGITDARDTAERRRVLKTARRWARWQRDQLRTNEAVERVARLEYRKATTKADVPGWDDALPEAREICRARAREVIDALIGGE